METILSRSPPRSSQHPTSWCNTNPESRSIVLKIIELLLGKRRVQWLLCLTISPDFKAKYILWRACQAYTFTNETLASIPCRMLNQAGQDQDLVLPKESDPSLNRLLRRAFDQPRFLAFAHANNWKFEAKPRFDLSHMVLHTLSWFFLISKEGNISSEEDRGELVDYSRQKFSFNTPSAKLLSGVKCSRTY